MKATPIAQYLEQKGRTGTVEWLAARREPSPFKPGGATSAAPAAVAAGDEDWARDASGFRRSGLIAAVSPRATEGMERGGSRGEAEATRRETPFFRARDIVSGPDLETRLAEAYHRGVQEGLDAAR